MHQIDSESETIMPDDDSLYPYVNNDIEYGLFEDIVDSYYLDGQIKDEWVVIGYHSKRLPKSAKNFGVTELELTGLLVNIHGFMQLLRNRYFEVLVDHKVIEYMIKSKTESPTTRLKTLLLKLSEYNIELKYQKGSEMHTSDALS